MLSTKSNVSLIFTTFPASKSMLRLHGHYFAIATLLIGISFQLVFQRWDLVGAASGLWIPMTSGDSWAALQFHSSKIPYYYIFLIFL